MSFDADLGPVNYVVVTFPAAPVPTGGLASIESLVDAGRIVVLDVEFVVKTADGLISKLTAEDAGAPQFAGAATDLIDEDDVALVADALAPGGVGLVLIYEDLTLLPTLQAWAAEGATLISEGPIIVDDLVATLDRTDQN